ncbi:MAG: cyclic nucleotide-binding domain-containing protein [Methylophilaceae bacterium]
MAIPAAVFEKLQPMAKLSASRKKELASLCFAEKVSIGLDPLRMNISKAPQAIYLLKGELKLHYKDDKKQIITGDSPAANQSLTSNLKIKDTVAVTDVVIVRVDADLLDIMLTWDQFSEIDQAGQTSTAPLIKAEIAKPEVKNSSQNLAKPARTTGDWMKEVGVFSALSLQRGIFSKLPTSNVEEMFKRMKNIEVHAGQVIMQQGDAGDYYYLIQSGTAVVSRKIGLEPVVLTELGEGGSFGEDALASDNKRNATVTMKTDGVLKRLNKADFIELLKEPLITKVSLNEAKAQIASGAAILVDVRLPSEYEDEHVDGAINLPLNEIRQLSNNLDQSKTYITYCQTGRRSSAAVFALAQCGLNAVVLADLARAHAI